MYGIIYKAIGPSGLVYIGQTTKSLTHRKGQHAYRAKKGDRRTALQIAILEYGFSMFTWDKIDTANSKAELDAKEKHWITYYQSDNPAHGYNSTDGGFHYKDTEETRRKKSKAHKGKERPEIKGRPLSAEHRRKLSEAMKGKNKGKQPYNKGKQPSTETRRKISEAIKGRKPSPETRKKMSVSAKRRGKQKTTYGARVTLGV